MMVYKQPARASATSRGASDSESSQWQAALQLDLENFLLHQPRPTAPALEMRR